MLVGRSVLLGKKERFSSHLFEGATAIENSRSLGRVDCFEGCKTLNLKVAMTPHHYSRANEVRVRILVVLGMDRMLRRASLRKINRARKDRPAWAHCAAFETN